MKINIRIIVIFSILINIFNIKCMSFEELIDPALLPKKYGFYKKYKYFKKFSKAFKDELMASESQDKQKAFRNAFIRGAVKVQIYYLFYKSKYALGAYLANGFIESNSNAILKSLDRARVPDDPISEGLYTAFAGMTPSESISNLRTAVNINKDLYNLRRKIERWISTGIIKVADNIHITEENIISIVNNVHSFMLNGTPSYIKTNYNTLLDKKKEKTSDVVPIDINSRISLSDDELEKVKKQNLIVDQAIYSKYSTSQDAVMQEICSLFQEHQEELDSFVQKHKELAVKSVRGNTTTDKSDAALLEFEENFMHSLYIIQSLGVIAGKQDVANKIASFSFGALNIVKGLRSIDKSGSFSLASITDIISGIASIASIFGHKDRTAEVIIDAINQAAIKLSKQISAFREETITHFNKIENQLSNQQKMLYIAFSKLHIQQNKIESAINELYGAFVRCKESTENKLDLVSQQLHRAQSSIEANLHSLRIEDINELITKINSDLKQDNLSLDRFYSYVTDLYSKALSRAKEPHLTGGNINIDSYEDISQAISLSELGFTYPTSNFINLLNNFINKKFNIQTPALAHPLVWSMCVNTLVDLLINKFDKDSHYPPDENVKEVDISKLEELLADGVKLQQFINNLNSNNYISILVQDYAKSIESLAKEIELEISRYEAKKTSAQKEFHQTVFNENKVKALSSDPKLEQTEKLLEDFKVKLKSRDKEGGLVDSYLFRDKVISKRPTFKKVTTIINGKKVNKFVKPKDPNKRITPITQLLSLFINRDPSVFSYGQSKYVTGINLLLAKDLISRYNSSISSLSLKLFSDYNSMQKNSIQGLVCPKDIEKYSIVLALPKGIIDIPSLYINAEQQGLGYIQYFYEIESGIFYLKVYFNINNSLKLIKSLKHTYTSLPIYSNNENVFNYWYGGIYAKICDKFIRHGFVTKMVSKTRGIGIDQDIINVFLPPLEAYPAILDTFIKDAKEETLDLSDLDKNIAIEKINQRRDFNKEIMSSLRGPLFALIKKVDAQFKIFSAILDLVYSENMQDPEFISLHNSEITYVKDSAAIEKFIAKYNEDNDVLASNDLYLHDYLRRTSQVVQNTVNTILGMNIGGQLPVLETSLTKLNYLIDFYKVRTVIPLIRLEISNVLRDNSREIAAKDQEIAELKIQNQKMMVAVESMQSELSVIKDQMQMLITLMTRQQAN